MRFFRRDGRLRAGNLWAVFVIALLVGAALGWWYRWYTHRDLGDRTRGVIEDLKSAVEKRTR